jgi:N6-L-threonylcarbamoyladenine synthase
MKDFGQYQILGETCDDAAGECFDKTARILGLGYPGGPLISSLSKKDTNNLFSIKLPRPMISHKNYDFSFSGLKTAVLYDFKNRSSKIKKSETYIKAMCFEIQQTIIDVLIYKTLKAAKNFRIKNIILGGGVSANKELRNQFKEKFSKEILESKLYIPDYEFSTDNGTMIAMTAKYHLKEALNSSEKIEANGNLRI